MSFLFYFKFVLTTFVQPGLLNFVQNCRKVVYIQQIIFKDICLASCILSVLCSCTTTVYWVSTDMIIFTAKFIRNHVSKKVWSYLNYYNYI